jgi:hypothetical protein
VCTDFVQPLVRITIIFPLLTPRAFIYADGVITKLENDFAGTTHSRLPKFPGESSPFIGTYLTSDSHAQHLERAEVLVITVDAALNYNAKTDFLGEPIMVNSKDALVLYLKSLKQAGEETLGEDVLWITIQDIQRIL